MINIGRSKDKQFKFYADDKEYQQIKKKVEKSKLTQSEFLLRSALDKKIIVIDGLREILIELSREGNNLNQIARALNQGEFHQEELKETQKKLMELWDLIENILKEGNK